MAELKGKVVRGFAWNTAERVASALFQAWVTINVLNRLVPDDTALIAILAALVMIFNSFVDSGFSQALIRKKNPAATDYSSVFWFNIAVATAAYILLTGLSYPTARILDMPDLVRFAPVFFLIVPISALGLIQQTVLTREFDFRKLSAITFASTVGSGLIAVGLAFAGFGVWALVGQRVGVIAIKTILLWLLGRWKLRRKGGGVGFSWASIREMFGYGSRLLATDLLNSLFNSAPQFLIGHIDRSTLGVYDTARKVRDLPVVSTMNAMQSVTFPAMAQIRDDDEKFSRAAGRVVGSIVFLMYPVMAGMIVISGEMFGVFLKAEWQASVPFFRILCIAGFATPLATVASNILRTRSDGRAVLRAEIVKKIAATVIFAATIPFGAVAITWGVVGIAFTDAAVSFALARRHSSYGFRALVRNVLPVFGLTAVMAAVVWSVGMLVSDEGLFGLPGADLPMWAVLAVKIVAGVAVYSGGAALFRFEAFGEFTQILKKVAGKIKS